MAKLIEARLIEADDVKANIKKFAERNELTWGTLFGLCEELVDKAPTADAVRVKHGEWEPAKVGDDFFWKCSYCGFPSEAAGAKDLYKYCPVCGAKMN